MVSSFWRSPGKQAVLAAGAAARAMVGLAVLGAILIWGNSALSQTNIVGGHPDSPAPNTNHHATSVTRIPKQLHQFSLRQKLNPVWWFGNADEPVPPKWYRPGQRGRTFYWHLRNPWHNFDCYVIGVSDQIITCSGRFPTNTFNPNGGWNWTVCRYKWWRLPFISYSRGRLRFYSGWRPSGAFGLELKLASRPKRPA